MGLFLLLSMSAAGIFDSVISIFFYSAPFLFSFGALQILNIPPLFKT